MLLLLLPMLLHAWDAGQRSRLGVMYPNPKRSQPSRTKALSSNYSPPSEQDAKVLL